MLQINKNYILIIFFFFFVQESFSQQNKHNTIGSFAAWEAYYWDTEEGKICSIMSIPIKEEGDYKKRGEVYTQVSINSNTSGAGVVSVQAGYTFKNQSEVEINIDNKNTVLLFTHERMAWAKSAEEDSKLIKFMKLGNSMITKGISSRGTNTKDTYSLKGFSAAYKAMVKVCK